MVYEDHFDGDSLVAIKRTDQSGRVLYIPLDSDNRHYSAYVDWKSEQEQTV